MKKNSKQPFLTIVVPTRDRPEMVDHTLYSLSKQTFNDFEVIVSDNYVNASCKHIFDKYDNKNFRYLHPEEPLSHCDHWDYACRFAKGKYVMILGEKYMMYTFAVSKIFEYASSNEYPDIINWWSEQTVPSNPSDMASCDTQFIQYSPSFLKFTPKQPCFYDSKEELKRRRNNGVFNITKEKGLYFRGKLYIGAYKKDLIDRIVKKHGRLFPPYGPDFTSLTLGLTNAGTCFDINKPLGLYSHFYGTGHTLQHKKGSQVDFINANNSFKYIEFLPIKGLYMSNYNWIAWDSYADTPRNKRIEDFVDMNFQELVKIVSKEFETQAWDDDEQEIQQKQILNNFIKEKGISLIDSNDKFSIIKFNGIAKFILQRLRLFNLVRPLRSMTYMILSEKRIILYDILCEFREKEYSWKIFYLKLLFNKFISK
jgi:glycosyltransferase involved in cell wall biosynthesis